MLHEKEKRNLLHTSLDLYIYTRVALEDMHVSDAPSSKFSKDVKDLGLVARAISRSSLCKCSSVSLVDPVLVDGCMVLLKIC